MDDDKHIERQVSLWLRCEALMQSKLGQMPTFEMTNSIYHETNKWLISDRIQKEREGGRTDQESRDGEPATQKQLSYIKDLGGVVRDGMTKGEASTMIEALRK